MNWLNMLHFAGGVAGVFLAGGYAAEKRWGWACHSAAIATLNFWLALT